MKQIYHCGFCGGSESAYTVRRQQSWAVAQYGKLVENTASFRGRLNRGMNAKLNLERLRLDQLQMRFQYLSPESRLRERRQLLLDYEDASETG